MKKLIAGLAAMLALVAPLVLAAPAEAAWNRGCVTRAEYQRIKEYEPGRSKGTTKVQTQRIFGTTGKRISGRLSNGMRTEGYESRGCRAFRGTVRVWFDNFCPDENHYDVYYGRMKDNAKYHFFSY